MAWLMEQAANAGWIVVGHSVADDITNYGARSAPLHKVTLTRAEYTSWTVKSIELLDEEVDVYCAVVPEVERFTLASGIYTSNCAFVSTKDMTKLDPSKPFAFLMEASMLGIGVGFDTLGAQKGFVVQTPSVDEEFYVIADTREGWVESTVALLDSYLKPNQPTWIFDYAEIREAGKPIRTFGGTAAGPEPLVDLHEKLRKLLDNRAGRDAQQH